MSRLKLNFNVDFLRQTVLLQNALHAYRWTVESESASATKKFLLQKHSIVIRNRTLKILLRKLWLVWRINHTCLQEKIRHCTLTWFSNFVFQLFPNRFWIKMPPPPPLEGDTFVLLEKKQNKKYRIFLLIFFLLLGPDLLLYIV